MTYKLHNGIELNNILIYNNLCILAKLGLLHINMLFKKLSGLPTVFSGISVFIRVST